MKANEVFNKPYRVGKSLFKTIPIYLSVEVNRFYVFLLALRSVPNMTKQKSYPFRW